MLIGVRNIRLVRRFVVPAVALLAVATWNSPARAQNNNNTNNNNGFSVFNIVGGVQFDPTGALKNVDRDALGELTRRHLEAVESIPDDLGKNSGLRKVSLKKLEAALKEFVDGGKTFPESMRFFAGLQEVRYVFVDTKRKDIVLAGPAEKWRFDPRGYYVGVTSGRPVMLLDDFLVAFRVALAKPEVLSCSINPTQEGIRRLETYRPVAGTNPEAAAATISERLGPQQISIHGVPPATHFARVMVAADYRMKRVSLALDPSPIRTLPSYADMIKSGGMGARNMMPRFWLQPEYQPLLRDDSGLAWEIRGATVRCLAETDFFDTNGIAHPTGRPEPISQRWADLMTSQYDSLAIADPVFAQLRNCMDLAVVSTLIVRQKLPEKAGEEFPLLTGKTAGLYTCDLGAPKQIATNCSLVKKVRGTVVAAGGVQINPWSVVEKSEKKAELTEVHAKAAAADGADWWWD